MEQSLRHGNNVSRPLWAVRRFFYREGTRIRALGGRQRPNALMPSSGHSLPFCMMISLPVMHAAVRPLSSALQYKSAHANEWNVLWILQTFFVGTGGSRGCKQINILYAAGAFIKSLSSCVPNLIIYTLYLFAGGLWLREVKQWWHFTLYYIIHLCLTTVTSLTSAGADRTITRH